MTFTVTSNSFKDGDYLPNDFILSADFGFGCAGGNRSTHLKWSDAPAGTKSFGVTCYDPDAQTGSGFWHWLAVNIPATVGELTEGEGVQGLQRAFHLAGCPDVIASLWQVDDAATAALMAKFYHELWVNRRPPLEALRDAQLTVYRHPERVPALAGQRGKAQLDQAVKLPPAAKNPGPAPGPK